ncbi:MAG: hypothetical protein JWM72_4724 [Actinomycetia bacterium]|nr:hypothetical protein [Actinomycetes bacterium]
MRSVTCTSCGREYPLVTAFVTKDSVATAIVYVACHAHDEHAEAWMDVAFGSFDEPDFADQATFSCRVRSEGVTLFPGPVAADGRAQFFGKMLSADEAKNHDGLPDVWAIVDFVGATEPTVRATVYGNAATP